MHIDLIYLVAQHIDPNPALLYRLATVSRDFYTVFTSDLAWKYLNPYGVESKICASFWKACGGDPVEAKIAALYWQLETETVPVDANLFAWLGTLTHTKSPEVFSAFEDNFQLLWCLFHLRGKSIMHATDKIKAQRELALVAVKNSFFLLDQLPPSIQDDREIVMLSLRGWSIPNDIVDWRRPPLQYVSERLRDDPEVVILACQYHGACFFDASARIKADREMVQRVIATQGDAILHSNFIDDREMVLLAAKSSWQVVCTTPKFKDDRDIILAGVSIPGSMALSVASPRLQADRKIVLAAIRAGANIKRIHPDLQNDREIGLALGSFPSSLPMLSSELRNDFDVVIKAVSVSGTGLRHASNELRDNIDIVMTAVSHNGNALEYASPRLRNNRDVAVAAIETDVEAFTFVSPQLKENDFEFVFKAIGLNGSLLYLVPPVWRSSRKLIKMALRGAGDSLQHLPLSLRNDEELISIAVAQNGMALRYANENFFGNREILAIAVAQDPRALSLAPMELREDREIMKIAIASNPRALKFAPNLCNDQELALLAIRGDHNAYRLIDDSLKLNLEFNIMAVSISGRVFSHLSEEMRANSLVQANLHVVWA